MLRTEAFEKLCGVIRYVFDDDSLVLSEQTTQDDVPDWDSLMHLTLLSKVEDEFGIHLQMKDMKRLHGVGDILDIIMEKTA